MCSSSYAQFILNVAEEDGTPSTYPYKLKVTNATLTDNSDGTASLSIGSVPASLAATLATGADANDLDITSLDKLEGVDAQVYIDLGSDGVVEVESDTTISAEAPNIQLRVDAAAYLNVATADGGITTISQVSDGTDEIKLGDGGDLVSVDSGNWDVSNAGVFSGVTGITSTGVIDLGGASDVEIENTAGDVTVNTAGEIAIDTTNNQLVIYTDAEYVIPLLHVAQGTFDLAAQYDVDSDLWLVDLHADMYPNGIYITKIYVDCTVADPTTELDANLMYCDAVGAGAFPGANATLIKAVDTTTGNFADAAVNTAVATGKTIYLDMDADPADANVQYHIRIHYRIEED